METLITALERGVLELLLGGDDPVLQLLREQLSATQRITREYTGVGFYTRFDISENAPRFPGNTSFQFGDVIAEIEGLDYGAGFVLFIDNGVLVMLEAYTFDEPWPAKLATFKFTYVNGDTRDFAALRATPGWPRLRSS